MTEPSARSVLLVIETHALARWVVWLAEALKRQGMRVGIELVPMRIDGASAVRSLLRLEDVLFGRQPGHGVERLAPSDITAFPAMTRLTADIVIDLTAGAVRPEARTTVLRPTFNGQAGETALAGALFFDGTPHIAIERLEPGADAVIVAEGTASLEAASGIGGAMEAVWSRVVTLIVKALKEDGAGCAPPAERGSRRRIGTPQLMRYSAKAVARKAARAAYELSCHPSHWRIGYRFVAPGEDVWSRRDLGGARWTVLADPVDHFHADPFPWHFEGRDYLFFEDLDYKTNKGVIAVVEFDGQGRPGTPRTVLEQAGHLSYPFLIEHCGEVFMIPETSYAREIAIYRADPFPDRWEKHAVLVAGIEAADATVIKHDARWWLFAVVRESRGGYSDTLAIWSADDLFGPWMAHPRNPVLVDDRAARPAGAMVSRDGVLYRPAQDCRAAYGAATNLMRVTRLDDGGFEQVLETTLNAGADWPGRRIHTLNYNGRLEAIDGFVPRPKLKALADRVDAWFTPKG